MLGYHGLFPATLAPPGPVRLTGAPRTSPPVDLHFHFNRALRLKVCLKRMSRHVSMTQHHSHFYGLFVVLYSLPLNQMIR